MKDKNFLIEAMVFVIIILVLFGVSYLAYKFVGWYFSEDPRKIELEFPEFENPSKSPNVIYEGGKG